MRAGRVVAALVILGVGCGVAFRLVAQAPLRLRLYASGFTNPLAFVQDPTDRAVQFVVEQGGRIRVVRDGVVSDTDLLDLRGAIVSGGEQGLLGLAFPPDPASPRFFVNFTDRSGNTVVARFRRSADNPFVNAPGTRREIWDFGLRNPWRYTFDDPSRGGTGALVIGDVGQNRIEEIDYEPRGRGGRNYGWRNREGAHDYITSRPPAFTPLVDPIFGYDHSVGASITGGYVYRGTGLGDEYQGRYFFADFVRARVWSLALAVDPGTGEARASGLIEHTSELGGTGQLGNVSSFGIDADGELYVVSYSRGIVFKLAGPLTTPPTPLNPRIVR